MYFPVATAAGLVVWTLLARMLTSDLRRYLAVSRGETREAPPAAYIYRRAQALPYRLAMLTVGVWAVIAIVGAGIARLRLGFDLDDTIVLATATLVLALAGAIYEQLWHRDVLRPLLAHLTQRYRVPVRSIAPSLSLRSKLMLSFGGVVLLACGMALLWGFVQYKSLSTESVDRQSHIGLRWLRSEIQAELGGSPQAPTEADVHTALRKIQAKEPEATSVIYFVGPSAQMIQLGGGPMGAPTLPWYTRALIERANDSLIALQSAELTGKAGRLNVIWRGVPHD